MFRVPRLRPSLLAKFSSVSFLLLALIGTPLALGIQHFLEQSALDQEAEEAAEFVAYQLTPGLRLADLKSPLNPTIYARLDALVREQVLRGNIVRAKVWGRDGVLLYSDERELEGRRFPVTHELADALDGRVASEVSSLDQEENVGERERFAHLLEVYVPLRPADSPEVAGAFEVYRDTALLELRIEEMRRFVWGSVALGFVILYGSLFTLVRNASRELVRRNDENARLLGAVLKANEELRDAYDATIEGWTRALDLRDRETEGHTLRVVEATVILAKAIGIHGTELTALRRGALMHDIGKLGVPDAILLKPGPLTDHEWSIMRRHPIYAHEMLSSISYLRDALDIPYAHHERWDGTGYPRGLKGTEIPLAARLFAVVDIWDALRFDRPYRAAWPEEQVREHIRSLAGTHLDPDLVRAFMSNVDALAACAQPPSVPLGIEVGRTVTTRGAT